MVVDTGGLNGVYAIDRTDRVLHSPLGILQVSSQPFCH
jgi:hypothetical protein